MRRIATLLALAVLVLGPTGTSPAGARTVHAAAVRSDTGDASWYDAPGDELEAAHRTLPFGTKVLVKNRQNGNRVVVVINDRGPYGVPGRIIDLSSEAFAKLAPLGQGVIQVKIWWWG